MVVLLGDAEEAYGTGPVVTEESPSPSPFSQPQGPLAEAKN